jgi:hypothetical protein
MLDRYTDHVGSSRKAKFILNTGAIICDGFVAQANCIGDLHQAVAFAEEPENLQVAVRQVIEGMQRRGLARGADREQGKFLGDFWLDIILSHCNARNG